MGKREIRHPAKQVDTGAYSAAVEVDGWVYVSGHASLDMATGEVIGDDIETQTASRWSISARSCRKRAVR